jgi:hypothetical protein
MLRNGVPEHVRSDNGAEFMPCDLNNRSHVSRGTASMLTRQPSTSAKVFAISSGVTRRRPSNSTTLRPVHDSWSGFGASRPTSAVATIGTGLSRGCRKLMMIPLSRARGDIPAKILHEPRGSKESNRHRQLYQHLLDDGVLCKQVGFTRLCTDRRQVYDSARICSLKRRLQRGGRRPRLRKTWGRIEVRRNQHEDSFFALECRSKRRGIGDIRLHDFATALCPEIPFADVAHHGPNRLPGGQKVMRDAAADIARNPSNCVHFVFSLRSHLQTSRSPLCSFCGVWPCTVPEEANLSVRTS